MDDLEYMSLLFHAKTFSVFFVSDSTNKILNLGFVRRKSLSLVKRYIQHLCDFLKFCYIVSDL